MKNKTSLMLMEQLMMVLVFALAAALCLTVFVEADRISRETQQRDQAILIAQNGAQVLKSCAGDPNEAAQILEGQITEAGLTIRSGDYIGEIVFEESGVSGLGQARIDIYLEKNLIFTLQTGWQEVEE